MKLLVFFMALSLCVSKTYAQNEYDCGIVQYKKLISISKKDSISDSDLTASVQLLRQLERIRCSDYTGKKNGQYYDIATRTGLFGDICLKKNDVKSVGEYINYLNRQQGSAEEELSYQFERIFQKSPELVLSRTGTSKYLLDHIIWGFVNNHYSRPLTIKNHKRAFFEYYPQLKTDYQQYKKQIDYLLQAIYLEVKG